MKVLRLFRCHVFPTRLLKRSLRRLIIIVIAILASYVFVVWIMTERLKERTLCFYQVRNDSTLTRLSRHVDYSRHLSGENKTVPLLILVTTFKSNDESDTFVYENTLSNWAHFLPFVQPVLFCDMAKEAKLVHLAEKLGWKVFQAKDHRTDHPVLKTMMLTSMKYYNSTPYCGYANADILFTNDLLTNLFFLEQFRFRSVLMTGRRTNYFMNISEQVRSPLEVAKAASRKGSLFQSNAQDFFITDSIHFPWGSIPEFVVGRVGYDNWLLVNAILSDYAVIDATLTLVALHQTWVGGNFAGHDYRKPNISENDRADSFFNLRLAGNYYGYSLGRTDCSHFFTTKSNATNAAPIQLIQRRYWSNTHCAKGMRNNGKWPALFEQMDVRNVSPNSTYYPSTPGCQGSVFTNDTLIPYAA